PARRGRDVAAAGEVRVVVGRRAVRPDVRGRLADSLSTAVVEGAGEAVVVVGGAGEPSASAGVPSSHGLAYLRFTERFRCPDHPDVKFLEPTPRLVPSHNPSGACPTCTG